MPAMRSRLHASFFSQTSGALSGSDGARKLKQTER
jgi:hypothetical protein